MAPNDDARSISIHELEEEKTEYSIFSKKEKYFIVTLAGLIAFWSTISSPIYLPVLPILQHKFNVNEEKMNITVVVYSIFQGLAPVLFSNLSDIFGRRLLVLVCLIVYMFANIGIALNSSYAGLLVLRCIQAFGIALTVSIGSGIASDITTKPERGSFIGITSGLSIIGQAFGALIGGAIDNSLGWRAIFWFLAISAGVSLLLVVLCLPETSRSLVGNGSSLPKNIFNRAPIFALPKFRRRLVKDNKTIQDHKPFLILDPFIILLKTPTYLSLIPCSLCYSIWLMMLTTLSHSLSKFYGYNTLHIGLSYIPSGIGGLLGSVIGGKLLDLNYKREYRKFIEQKDIKNENQPSISNNNHDSPDTSSPEKDEVRFNFIWARLSPSILPIAVAFIGIIIFGWSIYYKVHVALPFVGTFLVSYATMNFITISTTFIVDLNPEQSSCASSTVNLTRCWAAAIFIACLSKMTESMTIGGCYTFMGGIMAFSGLGIPYILINSSKWL